jgi:hypothetical protein
MLDVDSIHLNDIRFWVDLWKNKVEKGLLGWLELYWTE